MDKKDSGEVKIIRGEIRLTMPKVDQDRKALGLSIKKWELVLEYVSRNGRAPSRLGSTSCALCQVYLQANSSCFECPVHKKTSLEGCRGTPFYDFIEALTQQEMVDAAKDEIKFLKSLEKKDG